MSRYLKTNNNYRISSIRRNRNTKFDKRTVVYHFKTQLDPWSKYQHEISLRTENHRKRAKDNLQNLIKELLLWRRKSTSRLVEWSYLRVLSNRIVYIKDACINVYCMNNCILYNIIHRPKVFNTLLCRKTC